jgi:hypothetical protein
MINFIISGSQQNGLEENLIRPIAETLYDSIKKDDVLNLILLPLYNGDDETALYQAIQASNKFCIDNNDYSGNNSRHLGIHADAGYPASGASGLYYSEAGKNFITPILETIMEATPWDDVGLRHRTNLGELKNTIAVAGIIELSFYDDARELEWMQENYIAIANFLKTGIYLSLGLYVFDYEQEYKNLKKMFDEFKGEIQTSLNKFII